MQHLSVQQLDLLIFTINAELYRPDRIAHVGPLIVLRGVLTAYLDYETCDCSVVRHTRYEGAACAHCGRDHGWYCPDSPDHRCYCFTDALGDGGIEALTLFDGTVVIRDHQDRAFPGPDYQSPDSCLYCGQPEERK